MPVLPVLAAMSLMAPVQRIEVTVDLNATRTPIHPHIYGQFIEHLGRCIYGGIWAEMLEDRKFFYPVTKTFKPYSGLENSEFPIIGGSPWEIVRGAVVMSSQDPFVGKHSPILESGTMLRQGRLGTLEGKEYEGYVWAKGLDPSSRIIVRFGSQSATYPLGPTYKKLEFNFKAEQTSDFATLEIEAAKGNIAIGAVSLMPADNVRGMRRDTLAKLKELGGTIYRWPGGNFVSGYDWRDGIGDRDRRPPRTNPAWGGLEHNDFGTDEFIDFCREIHAEPLVTVNTGFGDAYTAAQWVEYCNGSTKTIGGSWRAKNGNRKPYDVKTWCVGNEMWGDWQLGHMRLEHYAAKHNWIAEAMLKVDPHLELIGSGDLGNGEPGSWSRGLLERSSEFMDMISEHFYDGRLPWSNAQRLPLNQSIRQMASNIRAKVEGHRKLQAELKNLGGKRVPIAMDEWNYWHRDYAYGELGCEYDHADGLGIAVGLHEFFRNTDSIHLATYAQTVNVIGAIKTTRTAAELESTGLVLQLYRHRFGTIPVKVTGAFGSLDVEAALSADRKSLTIGIVNSTNEPMEFSVSGLNMDAAHTYSVVADSETAKNTPGKPRQVDLKVAPGASVPRLSCGIIVIPL